MNQQLLTQAVQMALNEDLDHGDITSEAIFTNPVDSQGIMVAKKPGIIAGMPVVIEVYRQIDPQVTVTALTPDGSPATPGKQVAVIKGDVKSILAGERVSLNFLQHLSGIASQTALLANLVSDFPVRVTDTRKTTPGLRFMERYAVRVGGGYNHRHNLSEAVLIKDNHIAACGSVVEAINRARAYAPHTTKIEVEVTNETQVREAMAAQADIIMLDNMEPDMMAQMVALINHQALVEASGNITESNVRDYAATGVDIISIGSLTHTVKAMDISLEINAS